MAWLVGLMDGGRWTVDGKMIGDDFESDKKFISSSSSSSLAGIAAARDKGVLSEAEASAEASAVRGEAERAFARGLGL